MDEGGDDDEASKQKARTSISQRASLVRPNSTKPMPISAKDRERSRENSTIGRSISFVPS